MADDDVNVTLSPWQKVVAPDAVIVGADGMAFTVTVVPADAGEVQFPLSTETEYVPDAEPVIDCVVAPVDQMFPVADDEVNVTLSPWQKVVAPDAVIVGVAGNGFTVTVSVTGEAHSPGFGVNT